MTEGSALDAPVTAVTVFRDGARVVRTGRVDVVPGLRPVAVGNLPAVADPASVRVAARGRDLGLFSVEVQRRFGADPVREQTARLRSEVEHWRDAVQALDDEDAAEQAGLSFLGHLSDAAATSLARAVSSGRADYDDLARMSGHLSASTATALGRRREIAARKRAALRELEAAEERLAAAEQRAANPAEFVEVSVILEARVATEAEVDVSYHVSGASWHPLYDLTLNGERLTVSCLAEITQRTGEDWPEVALALSTTRSGLHQTLPELSPWYIGRARAVMLSGRAARAKRALSPGEPVSEELSRLAAGVEALPDAEVIAAQYGDGESGAGLVYTVARPLAVPADGGPHKTLIAQFDADAALDYLTVPVLASEAYLRATVTNGPLLLLPGQARVFHGSRFVGQTSLDTVAAGEEFEVQLGVDDQIRVERKLRRRGTSKAMIGGTRTVDIAYEITVENHHDRDARVSVHDHIPVSTDGEVKVRPREASPAPDETDELGKLIWNLSLEAGRAATIRHRFTVEHPAQVSVTGL
ncbi:MAG TPA: DUF4139 domain-containing protein [Trebonia sp.]